MRFLEIQREQCRLLRCTECCFCGGHFSEAPVDQEPQMLAAKSQRISEQQTDMLRSGGGTADGYGSEAEQQMDKNAGWDEGTCAQCGACYQRSRIRPALCPCGAELCGYSLRCIVNHAKENCSLPQQEHSPAAKQRRCAAASQEKETEEKNKDVDFEENNVLLPPVAALTPEKEKQTSRGKGRRGSAGFARPMS